MPKLREMSGAEVVRAFGRAGWRRDRQRDSHVVMLKPGYGLLATGSYAGGPM